MTEKQDVNGRLSAYKEGFEIVFSLLAFALFVTAPVWTGIVAFLLAYQIAGIGVAIAAFLVTTVVVFALTIPHLPGENK